MNEPTREQIRAAIRALERGNPKRQTRWQVVRDMLVAAQEAGTA